MATRMGRQRSALPPLYYEGYLEKRSKDKDKTSRKLWTCLCGNSMFFFNNNYEVDYMEKLDLVGLVSVKDDGTRDKKLDAARFIICLKDKSVKLTAPNLEARELWKGYIHSVVELAVPKSLNLLPGQLHMLNEAVEKEEARLKAPVPTQDRTGSGVEGDLPACYHKGLSRLEAELLLEREPERGNLLLRPGGHGSTFTVTTREVLDKSIFKHYQVTQEPGEGFYIALQKPIPCATLHDVIDLMVKETGGVLKPFQVEKEYQTVLSFIQSNKESGEKTVQYVSPSAPPPIPAPRILRGRASLESSVEHPRIYEMADSVKGRYQNQCPLLALPPLPTADKPDYTDDEFDDDSENEVDVRDAIATGSHDNGERTAQFARPSHAPPPLPTAPKPAEMKARAREALIPKHLRKGVSLCGREVEEKEADQSRACSGAVTAPRGLPDSGPSRTRRNRSYSDVCTMSEELRLKLAEKRLLCPD